MIKASKFKKEGNPKQGGKADKKEEQSRKVEEESENNENSEKRDKSPEGDGAAQGGARSPTPYPLTSNRVTSHSRLCKDKMKKRVADALVLNGD